MRVGGVAVDAWVEAGGVRTACARVGKVGLVLKESVGRWVGAASMGGVASSRWGSFAVQSASGRSSAVRLRCGCSRGWGIWVGSVVAVGMDA